jgi:hypothetical protein
MSFANIKVFASPDVDNHNGKNIWSNLAAQYYPDYIMTQPG